jgi:hypothetical protein
MTCYPCYFIDERGARFYADVLEAASDQEAIRTATAMLTRSTYAQAIEVWARGCRVRTVKRVVQSAREAS